MAAAKVVKRTGKENAPPVKSKKVSDDQIIVEDDAVVEDVPIKTAKAANKTGGGSLEKRLEAMTAERDRLRTQADTYTKQFDELCNLRTSEPEKLFEAYKQKADARSTAQNDVIKSLTEINDKLQARIQALEKAAKVDEPAAAPVKADPKEVKALKERLTRTESELRSRDRDFTQLDKMYKAEVEASQKLLASRSGTSAPATVAESGTAKEESVKDAAIIRLYEDMSDLCILEVRIKDGKFGPKDKEYTFSCIQTVGKNSAAFKLRTYTTVDKAVAASKVGNPYSKAFEFTPNFTGEADAALLKRLEDWSQPFAAPLSQLGEVLESFKACMAEEADDE